ncbi:MAG: translation initiation factor IF-2 [bacterium]
MNVSELARKLNISQQELREILPHTGFDIGARAIKVDNNVASKILKEWPRMYRSYLNEQQRIKEQKERELRESLEGMAPEEKKDVLIPVFITVKDFAIKINTPLVKVMQELMKNGVLATLNEKIDYDTASIIADEFGYKTELFDQPEEESQEDILKDILENEKNLEARPPVVVVMGHVDHGKTKLLDSIRKTDVVASEAGGITQHIGAYQVKKELTGVDGKKGEKIITFIDTPGHEAFTAMRSRGAKIADVAILVVAADDGVKPQTKEAIRIIEQAGLPMIVAINKIDKPEANIEKTKSELSELNLVPEDWGGKTVCVGVSALKGIGIDELLETVILTADMNEDKIQANPRGQGVGTVVESNINRGEGPVATIIVQNGTIRMGEYLYLDNDIYGKIRSMKNYLGHEVFEASPSAPVRISGLKILPRVGDIVKSDILKIGRKFRKKDAGRVTAGLDWHKKMEDSNETWEGKSVNLILKTDVVGSLEAIIESLAKIESAEVKINIIKKGLGNITEKEVETAAASNAVLLGFNVLLTQEAEKLALEKNVETHKYKIIYELLGFVKSRIEDLTEPKYEEKKIGKMKVLAIFRTENNSIIVGGKVIKGEIRMGCFIKVFRGERQLVEGKLATLESAKQKVNVCAEGQECGVKFEGEPIIKEGDILEFWERKKI